MVSLEVLRELALELPETEETTSYGTPAFKVRKKLFARMREEGDVLVVKVERDERAALIESEPDVFSTRLTTRTMTSYSSAWVRSSGVSCARF